jgi:hypothetical protein
MVTTSIFVSVSVLVYVDCNSFMYVHIDKPVAIPLQVKRCAEMSRKLKFFSDQINKAGVRSSVRPALQPEIDLEELEVR